MMLYTVKKLVEVLSELFFENTPYTSTSLIVFRKQVVNTYENFILNYIKNNKEGTNDSDYEGSYMYNNMVKLCIEEVNNRMFELYATKDPSFSILDISNFITHTNQFLSKLHQSILNKNGGSSLWHKEQEVKVTIMDMSDEELKCFITSLGYITYQIADFKNQNIITIWGSVSIFIDCIKNRFDKFSKTENEKLINSKIINRLLFTEFKSKLLQFREEYNGTDPVQHRYCTLITRSFIHAYNKILKCCIFYPDYNDYYLFKEVDIYNGMERETK